MNKHPIPSLDISKKGLPDTALHLWESRPLWQQTAASIASSQTSFQEHLQGGRLPQTVQHDPWNKSELKQSQSQFEAPDPIARPGSRPFPKAASYRHTIKRLTTTTFADSINCPGHAAHISLSQHPGGEHLTWPTLHLPGCIVAPFCLDTARRRAQPK